MKRRTKRTSARRVTVILSALVIALALVGSMTAIAMAADSVETRDSWKSGNASFECAQAGCTLSQFAFKVEPWDAGDPSGTYSAPGGASISINAQRSGGEYKSFSWSISDGFVVHCVIVKAGTGALIYRYGEDGATSDSGLQAYQGKGISHATFCYSKVAPSTGTLEVTKKIENAPDDTWGPEDFSITVTGPGSSTIYSGPFGQDGKVSLTGLAPGTYTITEQDPGTGWSVDIPADGIATIEAGTTTSVQVTNTYSAPPAPTGTLEVTKILNDSTGGFTTDDFQVQVTGPDQFDQVHTFSHGKVVLTGLTPGMYTVTEVGLPLTASFEVTIAPAGPVNVAAGEVTYVTITNSRTVTSPVTTDPNDTTTSSSTTSTTDSTSTSSTTTTLTGGQVDDPSTDTTTGTSSTDTTGPVVDEETTVPSSSSSTTARPAVQNQTTVPVPSGIIQTGGGGTADRGRAGVWALAALAAVLGVGILITSLRVKPGAE